MTINLILSQAIQKLKKISDTPQLDAEVLLSYVLKKPKEWLYAWPEYQPTKSKIKKIKSYLSRRMKHEPIAYITGHKEFYGLDFYVNKHVLIPRPETEALIEQVLREVKSAKYEKRSKLTIADIGTGSGCIAIAIAKNLPPHQKFWCGGVPQVKIYAIDISKRALVMARKNAEKHGVKIHFLHGDLLKPLTQFLGEGSEKVDPVRNSSMGRKNKKAKGECRLCGSGYFKKKDISQISNGVDIIVANLPYLSEKVYSKTSACIKKYEPKKALVASSHGLYFYKKLLKQAPKYLKPDAKLFLELGNNCSFKTYTGQGFS